MSRERFAWLEKVADEIIATPGTESNVKEIFDKCWELRRSGQELMIFNQFDELGNYLWHYNVTGSAMEEVFRKLAGPNTRFAGMASNTGSGEPFCRCAVSLCCSSCCGASAPSEIGRAHV